MDDLGVGECAGEVVSATVMEIAAAEREVFEAQVHLEDSDIDSAVGVAYRAIVRSARALVREQFYDVADNADVVVGEFRTRFFEKELFSPQFANYFFTAHQEGTLCLDASSAHRRIEEAQLFVEGAYICYDKIAAELASGEMHMEDLQRINVKLYLQDPAAAFRPKRPFAFSTLGFQKAAKKCW